jgi:8-oxo-dGTP diphosphatase
MTPTARTDQERSRPTVAADEVRQLANRYGEPREWRCEMPVDDYIRRFRLNGHSDRRAEVVFAIEDDGCIWVHAKRNYPRNLFRLPSGGIGWGETVESALLREIAEETALAVEVVAFLGLIRYDFHWGNQVGEFASYVFHVRSSGGVPRPDAGEAITEFRRVFVGELAAIAEELRSLPGERAAWGQWRAVAHELVFDALATGSRG